MSQEPKINFHTALISLQKRNKKTPTKQRKKKTKQNKQKKKKAENKTTEKISKQ